MNYSQRIKESVLCKILPPENRGVVDVSREMGIPRETIYNWKRKAEAGILFKDDFGSPLSLGQLERYNLLQEYKVLAQEDIGEWLREKGLHSDHLKLWEQEIKNILSDKTNKIKIENQQLKREKKELERELRRKEKALAEVAALLTLKKKADAIFGVREEE